MQDSSQKTQIALEPVRSSAMSWGIKIPTINKPNQSNSTDTLILISKITAPSRIYNIANIYVLVFLSLLWVGSRFTVKIGKYRYKVQVLRQVAYTLFLELNSFPKKKNT